MEHQESQPQPKSSNSLQRKTSLKRKSTLKEPVLDSALNLNEDQTFKRRITWNIEEGELNKDGDSALNRSSERSYSNAKTHYSDIVIHLF